ncbi:glycoside hydrolase 5 family protein [Cyclobacterium roseum]|uniref:hypothetical protein n=1 Tax=Cyclobacterium roseum TaxID=2666137 RepID=UPI0013907ECD|nr:hypothetical protein [Cyclobacterium roseum]
MSKPILYTLLIFFTSCNPSENDFKPEVEIIEDGNQFQLYRHGEPYFIKGASGFAELEKLKDYGGNSLRTWNTENAGEILDQAHQLGLTVTLGLEVGREWWGQDFQYWNLKQVNEKIEGLRMIVEKYKDHPALLMWGLGNEVHVFGGNRLLIMLTLNKIAKMIHDTDPNHPVMTTTPMGPGFSKYGLMRILCPYIDLLGVNGFERIPDLYGEIRSPLGWNKPYILSEWGPQGHWESGQSEWGASYEKSSSEKALLMDRNWEIIHRDQELFLGGYAFYWGHKYEVTHTFFSLFSSDGLESESVNILQSKWKGDSIDNWAPRIDSVLISPNDRKDNIYLVADSTYQARVMASDVDGDTVRYWWELRPEGKNYIESGDFNNTLQHLLTPMDSSTIRIRTPAYEGPYRLFVFAYDNHDHFASHNIPFYVVVK